MTDQDFRHILPDISAAVADSAGGPRNAYFLCEDMARERNLTASQQKDLLDEVERLTGWHMRGLA